MKNRVLLLETVLFSMPYRYLILLLAEIWELIEILISIAFEQQIC